MSATVMVYNIARVYAPPQLINVPETNDPGVALAIYLERQLNDGAEVRGVRGDKQAFVVKSKAGLVSRVWIAAVGFDEDEITRDMPPYRPEEQQGS